MVGHVLLPFIGYRSVGFLFLVLVLLKGLNASMGPILFQAFLSSFIWNFFFIPPSGTFFIEAPEDVAMCLTFLVAAIVTGSLARRSQRLLLLEESEKLHQAVLNSVSHEIKIPLSSIIGFAATLDDKVRGTKNLEAFTGEIRSAAQRLKRVVENLLDMSRLSQGNLRLNREWYEMDEIIERSIETVTQQFSHALIDKRIETDGYLMVHVDFSLMETVVRNLLYNAIQHRKDMTPVTVTVCKVGKRIEVSVFNVGSQIPEVDLRRVFEKFYRVSGSVTGGTGLGLAICESIVTAHQGKITAKNIPNGVKISFSLPYKESYTE